MRQKEPLRWLLRRRSPSTRRVSLRAASLSGLVGHDCVPVVSGCLRYTRASRLGAFPVHPCLTAPRYLVLC